jgi:hypothetical protein
MVGQRHVAAMVAVPSAAANILCTNVIHERSFRPQSSLMKQHYGNRLSGLCIPIRRR